MVIQIVHIASNLAFRSVQSLNNRARGEKTRMRVTILKRGERRGEREREETKKYSHSLKEERC